MMFAQQVAWLVLALTSWTLSPKDPTARAEFQAVRQRVATEVVTVAYDPAEHPLFAGRDGRAHTAALLASIAANETRLRPRVLAGDCPPGECDQGEATGLMQIHAGTWGIRLEGSGYKRCGPKDDDCMTADDLVRDETAVVRVALHMLRRNGLGSYTGEGKDDGPAASKRRGDAAQWVLAHPPPAADADVLGSILAQE